MKMPTATGFGACIHAGAIVFAASVSLGGLQAAAAEKP